MGDVRSGDTRHQLEHQTLSIGVLDAPAGCVRCVFLGLPRRATVGYLFKRSGWILGDSLAHFVSLDIPLSLAKVLPLTCLLSCTSLVRFGSDVSALLA